MIELIFDFLETKKNLQQIGFLLNQIVVYPNFTKSLIGCYQRQQALLKDKKKVVNINLLLKLLAKEDKDIVLLKDFCVNGGMELIKAWEPNFSKESDLQIIGENLFIYSKLSLVQSLYQYLDLLPIIKTLEEILRHSSPMVKEKTLTVLYYLTKNTDKYFEEIKKSEIPNQLQ